MSTHWTTVPGDDDTILVYRLPPPPRPSRIQRLRRLLARHPGRHARRAVRG